MNYIGNAMMVLERDAETTATITPHALVCWSISS